MANKILEKIDKFFDYLILLRPEKKSMNKSLKKICKHHCIRKEFLEMYLRIQNEILEEVNKETAKETSQYKIDAYFCTSILMSRIFELNFEFVQAVKKEFYHSANALTRQVIEIYLVSALINCDESYCQVLVGKDGKKKIPPFKNIIDDYLDKKNQTPKLGGGLTKEMFFNGVKTDYHLFSGLFHPKEDSFIHNIWIADRNQKGDWINTRAYKEIKDEKDITIFLFPKKTPFHPEYIKRMTHVFYTYSGLAFDEVMKLKTKL